MCCKRNTETGEREGGRKFTTKVSEKSPWSIHIIFGGLKTSLKANSKFEKVTENADDIENSNGA
ncbi:hypothetical protein RUM44_003155 [Polyplax serrata]|uniref:Uncharacterized protein n=1 Tax=Polyplax serrata TaxID=468196 RepID=A0ABR1AXP9_POLSC